MRALSARLERLQQRLDAMAAMLEPAPGGVIRIAAIPGDVDGSAWSSAVKQLGLTGLIVPAIPPDEWGKRALAFADRQQQITRDAMQEWEARQQQLAESADMTVNRVGAMILGYGNPPAAVSLGFSIR